MQRRVLAGIAVVFLFCVAAPAQQSEPAPHTDQTEPQQPAPLPDIQTLLAHVRARYDALESLRKNYICTMTQVADEFSSDGSKKTHTDQYQAFYVGNTEVLQHIARDGKPLSVDDARKEQERVDKEVAKLKEHATRAQRDEVRLSASGLLKVATFSNPRRETLSGRPTLIFDYKGDPNASAKDLSEQIMRQLAGTIWIDERDEAIVRLTGALQQNFHVGGGLLVNIRKGSWFNFVQAPVNGEIWFPAEFTAHVDGRFLLLKGFNGNVRDSFSEYKKMKTSVTILPGAQLVEENGAAAPADVQPGADSSAASTPKQ
ncbi:MAG TPA: hypothetical protein VGM11_12375 [Acidobacteriaceae bacterium]|jgi:hypothetical protein